MEVYDHLDIRIFLKIGFQIIPGIIIGSTATQSPSCHVELFFEMDNLISIIFSKKLCQIISHSYNSIRFFPFSGICKCFL